MPLPHGVASYYGLDLLPAGGSFTLSTVKSRVVCVVAHGKTRYVGEVVLLPSASVPRLTPTDPERLMVPVTVILV